MIVQVRTEIKGDEQLQRVIRQAILHGYKRVDPSKGWSQLEYKHAAKYAFERILQNVVNGS